MFRIGSSRAQPTLNTWIVTRNELVRITSDQVVAKTTTESVLPDAQAQPADSKAQLFDAEMRRVVAQAELVRRECRQ